jgi:dihydroorotate dehydrogenase
MVYKGPGLVREITQGLAAKLKSNGMTSIEQAVGQEAETLARGEGLHFP